MHRSGRSAALNFRNGFLGHTAFSATLLSRQHCFLGSTVMVTETLPRNRVAFRLGLIAIHRQRFHHFGIPLDSDNNRLLVDTIAALRGRR
jgi:hypothetical protein